MRKNQKKKFFINNSVEAVISLKHQGLLKLHESLRGRGVPVLPNIPGNVLKQILVQKFQHLIRGIYENRGVYFFSLKLNQYI